MDPRLVYWTFALLDLAAVALFAAAGVAALRRGDVARHRRRMLTAAALVGFFVLSYVAKLALIGREDLESWGSTSIWVLRIHELWIFLMLAAGAVAGSRALRLRHTRNVTRDPKHPPAPAELVRWHRRAGWTAVCAAGFALGFALLVLLGMYRRAGWL
ncbi:MAG TPA: DUF420 domain-containing protein [Myxococcota bacterium]|jgi:uncharacterized membrane protein YozB (DUF420 family)